MIEPVDLRIDSLEAARGLRSKRFGLFTVGKDGRPGELQGRFDDCHEILSKCGGSTTRDYLVEVSHYAYLKVEDFADLFGPLPHARTAPTEY